MESSVEALRRAAGHLLDYLDGRPGRPLVAYEADYAYVARALSAVAAERGTHIELLAVEGVAPEELRRCLASADKFLCAFNRRYQNGFDERVRLLIEYATSRAERAFTLSDISDDFIRIFQVPPARITDLNRRVAARLSEAREVRVTDPAGTDLHIGLSRAYEIVHIDGFSESAHGLTVNLPPGEVATYSDSVRGVIRFRGGLLGTIPIGRKYGFIDEPVTLYIEDGRVVHVECKDAALLEDLYFCLDLTPFTRNVCEIGFGTHPAIRELKGLNYTFEEKHHGFHLGFGATLAQQNVERVTDHHLDLLFADARVEADGAVLFDGIEYITAP